MRREVSSLWFVGIGPRWAESNPLARPRHFSGAPATSAAEAPFLFLYFSKIFFTEIYFQYHNLQFCTPTARQGGGRGPAAQQRGGRDLYVNLKKNYLCGSPWREPAARQGAAGSPILYKRVSLPLPPHLLPTTSREREGERRGEGESCNGEALPNFGS